MSHAELVARGKKWLINNGWNPVFTEQGFQDSLEKPDIIAWRNGCSVLFEVKVSIEDFKRDSSKIFREKPECGMGSYRYYLVPEEIADEILPALPHGWGLKSFQEDRGRIHNVKESECFNCKYDAGEIMFLVSRIKEIQRFGKG